MIDPRAIARGRCNIVASFKEDCITASGAQQSIQYHIVTLTESSRFYIAREKFSRTGYTIPEGWLYLVDSYDNLINLYRCYHLVYGWSWKKIGRTFYA